MDRIPTHIILSFVPYFEQPLSDLLAIRLVSREWYEEGTRVIFNALAEPYEGLACYDQLPADVRKRIPLGRFQSLLPLYTSIRAFGLQSPIPLTELLFSTTSFPSLVLSDFYKKIEATQSRLTFQTPTIYYQDFIHDVLTYIIHCYDPPQQTIADPYDETNAQNNEFILHSHEFRHQLSDKIMRGNAYYTAPHTGVIFSEEIGFMTHGILSDPARFGASVRFLRNIQSFKKTLYETGDPHFNQIFFAPQVNNFFATMLFAFVRDSFYLEPISVYFRRYRPEFTELLAILDDEIAYLRPIPKSRTMIHTLELWRDCLWTCLERIDQFSVLVDE